MPRLAKSAHHDVLIVGARCAGAATAMLLARAGLKVLVVDRDAAGSDTMSTHALMRSAVEQLSRWGLLNNLIGAGTPYVRRTTFQYGTARYPVEIRPSGGLDGLVAPRRDLLDAELVAAARAAGAEVRHRTSLVGLVHDAKGRVRGARLSPAQGSEYEVSADLVIGADGRRSTVARRVGAQNLIETQNSSGCIYAYFEGIEDLGYRWFYDTQATAGLIPTNGGLHCVFAAVSEKMFRSARCGIDPKALLLALAGRANAELGDELAAAEMCERPILFSGANGHIRQSHGPGWALVGDAGYFKDPISAHGISDALRDAEILSRAVVENSPDALARYQHTRDALSRDLFHVTDRMASYDWTLREMQDLHMHLKDAMKAELAWMRENFAPAVQAA